MNGIVLGALAVMWITVLSWEGIQGVREGMGRRGDSLTNFRRQLDVMSRRPHQLSAANRIEFAAGGARLRRSPRYTPTSRFEAARRRRDGVLGLGCLSAAATAGYFVTGSSLSLYLFGITATAFLAFCASVVRRRQIVAERAAKVRYLPSTVRSGHGPAYARRRAN